MNKFQLMTILAITTSSMIYASDNNSNNNNSGNNIFDARYSIQDLKSNKIEGFAKDIIFQQKRALLGLAIASNNNLVQLSTSPSSRLASQEIDRSITNSTNCLNLIKIIQEVELNERKLNNTAQQPQEISESKNS